MIGDVAVAYGGVAPLTKLASKAMAALQGRPLDGDALRAGLAAVEEDVQIAPDAPGGWGETIVNRWTGAFRNRNPNPKTITTPKKGDRLKTITTPKKVDRLKKKTLKKWTGACFDGRVRVWALGEGGMAQLAARRSPLPAAAQVQQQLPPPPTKPNPPVYAEAGMVEYRRSLAASLLFAGLFFTPQHSAAAITPPQHRAPFLFAAGGMVEHRRSLAASFLFKGLLSSHHSAAAM